MKSLLRRLLPLRMRHQIRILARKYPYGLRSRFPELNGMSLPLRPVVFDVGANVGYFAEAALAFRPWAEIHLFEPLPEACATLAERLSGIHGLRINQFALAAEPGERELLVSRFDEASSFLELGSVLRGGVYGIDFSIARRIPVRVETIQRYMAVAKVARIDLLKLDVQGYELEVLRGAEAVLDRISWIYAEVQYQELYRDGPRADEVSAWLTTRGFRLVHHASLRYDDRGELMECDMIFRAQRE